MTIPKPRDWFKGEAPPDVQAKRRERATKASRAAARARIQRAIARRAAMA